MVKVLCLIDFPQKRYPRARAIDIVSCREALLALAWHLGKRGERLAMTEQPAATALARYAYRRTSQGNLSEFISFPPDELLKNAEGSDIAFIIGGGKRTIDEFAIIEHLPFPKVSISQTGGAANYLRERAPYPAPLEDLKREGGFSSLVRAVLKHYGLYSPNKP